MRSPVGQSVRVIDAVDRVRGRIDYILDLELPRIEGSETRLREMLGPVRERFDCTLLDCPPSLGPVTVNALVAADRVIVPVQAEYLALEGLVQFLETLDLLRRNLNPTLILTGVLITMHYERTRLAHDVEAELRQHLPEQVFDTVERCPTSSVVAPRLPSRSERPSVRRSSSGAISRHGTSRPANSGSTYRPITPRWRTARSARRSS